MPQSFCQIYGHLVFSTKLRHRWLDVNLRAELHAYLAGALRKMECADVHIGGTDDHVHALFLLSKKVAPVTLVQELKQSSSKHIKTLSSEHGVFAWQRGYALFSVSPTARAAVRRYIEKQEEHHRHATFQDELRELLKKAGLKFDECYLWD
ncbi:MAG: IS200/IS605 family transposase [Candidatus Pacebacteria bacterium]|nr:IS200/IS605 family transposase [Candidatus Paceibacterota bacterium]